MASWEDWGDLVLNHIFYMKSNKRYPFWRQAYSLRKEIWHDTRYNNAAGSSPNHTCTQCHHSQTTATWNPL
jgi:hypothetical protein